MGQELTLYHSVRNLRFALQKSLDDYVHGRMNTVKAQTIAKLAGKLLEAMRVEVMTCPMVDMEPPALRRYTDE